MNEILAIVGVAEALTLLYVLIILAGLQNRMKRLNERSSTTVNQMRDLVQEAQTLSTVLATQLAEQARMVKAGMGAQARPQTMEVEARATEPGNRGLAGDGPAVKLPTMQPPGLSEQVAALTAAARDQDLAAAAVAARERGMDPLGVALQRGLRRRRSASA